MSDSVERFWVIPLDPSDMEPLPAFINERNEFWNYDRKKKKFEYAGDLQLHLLYDLRYPTFEECRAAMIEARTAALKEAREHSRLLAASIEHIRTIPTAPFPDVIREVPEAQQQEEAQEQKEAEAEQVKPAKPTLKRPVRKN